MVLGHPHLRGDKRTAKGKPGPRRCMPSRASSHIYVYQRPLRARHAPFPLKKGCASWHRLCSLRLVMTSSSKPLKSGATVTPLSPAPLYAQIKELLRERILDGSYKPHEQMPSESEMMATFGVSRITVRQALNDLQQEGLIFRIHGKGTFVSKPKAFQDLGKLQGFGEAMRQMGYET